MTVHNLRTFEVPAVLVAAGHGPTVDLDVLDREVEFPGPFGEWAEQILFTENAKTLTEICGSARLLPRGILSSVQLDDGSLLIDGLLDSDGRVWNSQFNSWGSPTDEINVVDDTVILDDDEVAFVARALREGADEVWFRPFIPKAFVSAVVAAPAPAEEPPALQEVPTGSAIIAVVDPIDEDAVLEMLAITPGPNVLRRHDGQWFEDPEWIQVLKSVKPPKIVKLTEAQVASVATQVDRSTIDQEWEPFEVDDREQYQIFTASSYIQELQRESDETALFALVAVAGRELTPKDVVATERLKRYWTVGKGAAKIRWGTPGSWRRCYRHLVKYVGPRVAPGYCTNLSMRLGGPGIATHVGKVKPIPGRGIPGSADGVVVAAVSGDAWDIQGHKVVIDPEEIGETWYSHPDGSIGDPACLGSNDSTIWVRDPTTHDETWRICPEHGTMCEDDGYRSTCEECGWTNHYIGYGLHPLETADAVTAANPSGRNGYDSGKSFEESTGGVERDYHGRFAPEGRSTRSRRRGNSVNKSRGTWDESPAKFKILPDPKKVKAGEAAAKKDEAARKRAENTAQREELAKISLEIASLRAEDKDLEAAELRVRYAELAVEYADTPTQKLNAQAALINAQSSLRNAKIADLKKRQKSEAEITRRQQISAEQRRREQRRRDAEAAAQRDYQQQQDQQQTSQEQQQVTSQSSG